MNDLKLMLATPENGLMNAVISEWDRQLATQRLPKSIVESLRSYEASLTPDKRYGVFILCSQDDYGNFMPPFEAYVHVNHAHSKSPKPTLRLVWNKLAPRYEWEDHAAENHGRIYASIIHNAINLSKTSFKSTEIKLYLFSAADRKWGRTFVDNVKRTEVLTSKMLPLKVQMSGNWLHLIHR